MSSEAYDNTALLVIRKDPGVGNSGRPKPTITFKGNSGGFAIDLSLWPNEKAAAGEKMYTGKMTIVMPGGQTKDFAGEVAAGGDVDFGDL